MAISEQVETVLKCGAKVIHRGARYQIATDSTRFSRNLPEITS